MYRAAENGHEAEVQLLLKHKANVNAKTVSKKTALYRETVRNCAYGRNTPN
jgi:ankyrin repeat protein